MNVTAIIPAYNEEQYIGEVLSAVCSVDVIKEIIVISDGSTDNTAGIARAFKVDVIELERNCGKGFAMKVGLYNVHSPIILFLDADLKGIKSYHVENLIIPIQLDIVDMTLGVFHGGRSTTDLAQKITPFLTGQRAIKKSILDDVKGNNWPDGFGIELMLTKKASEKQLRILKVPLDNVSHVMKEEKMGISKGLMARFKMYWEIAKEFNRN